MRRRSELTRSTAAVLVLALATGCAASRAAPVPPATQLPVPAPGPPTVTVTTPEAQPSLPPVSVGPRREVPVPRPPTPPRPPQRVVESSAPPVPRSARGKFVVLNFDNADIETVIHAASEIVGFNYVLAPDVKGKVTVQTSGRIPQEDVFGVLLAILEVYGFTAVKSGTLYKIIRIEGARERAVPTIIGAQPDPNRTGDEVITQIIPLRYANVTDMSTLLRPLISPRGTLIAHRETNVVIITDTASNVRRLLDILRLVDVEVALDTLEIIQLFYADANTLAGILNQLLTSGRLRPSAPVPGVPGAAPLPAPLPTPTPVPGVPPTLAPGGGPAGTTTGTERRPLILAEPRSNSLVIYASRAEVDSIRRLVAQLDVNIYSGRRVFMYFAENAKAKDLVATLNAIYGVTTVSAQPTPGQPGPPGVTGPRAYQPPAPPPPPPTAAPGLPVSPGTAEVGLAEGQIRFIADETTNAVIVQTTPKNWPQLEETIKQLDRMPRQVLIEVLVAEVTLTGDTRLGIDWAIRSGKFSLGQSSSGGTIPTTTGLGIQSPSNLIPSPGSAATFGPLAAGLTAFTFNTDQFFAILNTLAAQDKLNVLSNPHVMTSENKKAVINVSKSVPIVTSQQVPIGGTVASPTAGTTTSVVGTQSVEYRDAGVVLTVTPRIGERGTVALDVKQEVNSVGVATPPTGSPTIVKREAETSVVLLDRQTLVLGGLITDSRETISRGIPVLKDIPILGFLFGFKERLTTKDELLILITPRVVGTAVDAARVTDQMRHGTPDIDETFKRAPRPPSTAPPPPRSAPAPIPVPPAFPAPAPPAPGPEPAPPAAGAPPPPAGAPPPETAPQGAPPIPPAPPPPR